MRMIDIFQHILPPKYKVELCKRARDCFYMRQIEPHPTLFNIEARFKVIDRYPGLQQVMTMPTPTVEYVVGPKDAVELARMGNEEMAEMIAKYPDRFVGGVASLPMNDIDAALKELDYSITTLNLNGIQLTTNINGKPLDDPEFLPFFEKMQAYDLPIWIHPHRDDTMPDYTAVEKISKYGLFSIFGWPYETTIAMARLVFSGVMDKFPNIKIITHHCGAMIPYFNQRMASIGISIRDSGAASKNAQVVIPPIDHFRRFYVDTILGGNVAALQCGFAFYGADHMLFATDYPFGGKATETRMAREIAVMGEWPMATYEKEKILYKNAIALLKLKT